jgi:hypothetical protein
MSESSNLITVTQKRFQCRHVHAGGNRCGSPALRNEEFCYFHHTTRRPKRAAGKWRLIDAEEPFDLPVVDDLASALSVASQILCRIASNDLDPTRAGKLLYNLHIITSIIDKASRAAKTAPAPASTARTAPAQVEELVPDEAHGPIAPIAEFQPPQPAAPAPPPPPRLFTPEEVEYFKNTITYNGYEPKAQHPRLPSIADEDIQAQTNEKRRAWCLPLLKPRKDSSGRLIFIHEKGAEHTIPQEPSQAANPSLCSTTIPTLQAVAPFTRQARHKVPSKTARTARHLRRLRKGQRTTKSSSVRRLVGARNGAVFNNLG